MEYNSLKTGATYRLTDLFSKDNKIIIPDLQRDYCWGTTNDKDGNNLVDKFVDSLIKNQDKELNLGLLYGYEAPLGHLQLCDGQQRITTLFLMIGMLNKKTDNAFRRLLISESEEQDDWEPYLQYAIRESSLYFLSDLTRFFFIENKNLTVDEIKHQPWYFKDYNLDPSIQSMISAMKTIERKTSGIDCIVLGSHIASKLTFLYYDMGSRSKGEETFVVINTTGEPLSSTENLKPLLINKQPKEKQNECAQKWEQWEQFFWKNRGKNDTADNGLEEFFRWVMLLKLDVNSVDFKRIQNEGTYKFDINIGFEEIETYFKIVSEKMFPDNDEEAVFRFNRQWLSPGTEGNSQIDWFRILPVLEYIKRYPEAQEREVLRVKMFFRNLSFVSNIKKGISEVFPEAIKIVKNMGKDLCMILDLENVKQSLLSDESRMKLQIYRCSINRNEIEDAFWKEEENKIWSGEIMPLLQWSNSQNSFDFNSFKCYRDKFNKVFHDDLRYNELDITRRALLASDIKDYPRIFKGNRNTCFALDYEDWKALINDNIEQFKSFLDSLDNEDIYKAQQKMIDDSRPDMKYAEFVRIPELLEYCGQKKIQWWGDELGWTLIKGDRASGEYANLKSYRLYLDLKGRQGVANHDLWFYSSEGSCVAIDENASHTGWAIDAWHTGCDKYTINLFHRNKSMEYSFKDIPIRFGLVWNGERYEKKELTKDEVLEMIQKLLSELNPD